MGYAGGPVGRPLRLVVVALALLATAAAAQQPYYYAGGQRYPLLVSDTFVAVQATSPEAAERLVQSRTSRALAGGGAPTEAQRRGTLVMLRVAQPSPQAAQALAAQLAASPEVARVLPTWGRGEAVSIETDELVVQFTRALSAAERDALANRYGVLFVRPLGPYAPQGWLLRVANPAVAGASEIAAAIYEQEQVRFSHPNFVAPKQLRARPRLTPNDPLYPSQWHLDATGQLGTLPNADINAPEAWDETTGDPNIVVAVIDSGVEEAHEEFSTPGKILQGYDFIDDDTNPAPNIQVPGQFGNAHGTACAGVIAATGNNGLGVSGVAPDCSLMGIRLVDFGSTLQDEADSFYFAAARGAHVLNNSWGPADGLGIPQPLPDIVRAGIDYAADTGRGGLGCVILWAAGNGAESADLDGYASYDKVISVAASTDQDVRASYSDFGASVDICAPSGDSNRNGVNDIYTTDFSGPLGYSLFNSVPVGPNYTNLFNGTSAACPVVAGVAALILSVDSTLTRQEVQQILESTASRIDQAGGNYDGSGHSIFYGYGKVDAQAAVNATVSRRGTPVTLFVETEHLDDPLYPGVRPTSNTFPIEVTYTVRGAQRTVQVYEGINNGAGVTIGVDPGTTVSFALTDAAGSTQQRWVTSAPVSQVVADQPITLTGRYYHQLRRNFRVTVQTGGLPVNAEHPVVLTTLAEDRPVTTNLVGDSAGTFVWADTGTAFQFAAEATNPTINERWQSADRDDDGQPDPVVGRIELRSPVLTALYYHQVRARVVLRGTSDLSTVSTSRRQLLGRDQQVSGLFEAFQDFCDNNSQLAFSETSLGSPILKVSGVHQFVVAPGLNEEVVYVVQPRQESSSVTVNRVTAPANGTTAVDVTVTLRDSAGEPVPAIDPARVDLLPTPADGFTIIRPTTFSDANGRLVFRAARAHAGEIVFHAAIDGVQIDSEATVRYLPPLQVPLSLPGVYLLSFPITPSDSRQTFLDFNLEPRPTQVARYNPVTQRFDVFNPNANSGLFNIQPGVGFFVRTTAAGTAELTGAFAEGPNYNLPLSPTGFHLVGNPQADRDLIWRLGDFEVYQAGASQGLLSDPANWQRVDPFVWAFDGRRYELVVDPSFPGTEGLRSSLKVYEGFFWRSLQEAVGVIYTPNSGRSRAAEPISPANFGFSLQATAGDQTATVILGAQRRAMRVGVAPPAPEAADEVQLTLVTPEGGRAAADYLGQPVTVARTWEIDVACRAADQEVTLTWPSLNRQLPKGYRVKVEDPASGRSILLNTHAAYTFRVAGGQRRLLVTVLPRTSASLQVVQFEPTVSRGRSTSFNVTLTGEARVFLRVTSLSGRVIAETGQVDAAGTTALAWNGLDNDGRPVPAGVYQVTLIAVGETGETVRAVRTVTVR